MYKRCTGQADAVRFWMVISLGFGLLWNGAWAQESSTDTKEAAKAEVDPSGTWKWEREFRDNLLRSTLKVKKGDGGKLTGTLQTIFGDGGGPGSDPVKIDDGKIAGENVTFSVTRNFNGNEFTIDYKGNYANGDLGGTYTLDFGNGPQEIEWKAKRHIDLEDVVGKWNLSFERRDGQKIESSMTVKADGKDKVAGTYHSGFFGDAPMKNISIKDGALSWDVVFATDNGEFPLSYSGKLAGDSMKGTIKSAVGGQQNETPFTAKLETSIAQKLYELRIYETHDGKLPNLQARFRDHTLRLFEKHGMENIVYWTVSEGANGEDEIKDNLLVYVIAHKDEASREASWKGFMTDPEWKQVATESEKDGPILAKPPRSILMTATDFSDHMKPNKDSDGEPRLFELRQYNDGPERVPSTVDRFASGEKDLFTKHGMTTVSFWKAEDDSAFIYLLAHKDREASRKSWEGFFPDFREYMAEYRKKNAQNPRPAGQRGGGAEVRFLVPTDYSPVK